jgi:hypothetical protein
MNINADKSWYYSVSGSKLLPLHCPFSSVERCPRYYQSLSLLSKTGGTSIDPVEDKKLERKWKKHELWPKIDEHATSVTHASERLSSISNFCPEVTYDRFHLFCTSLASYADEIDIDIAHKKLQANGASSDDPNWRWVYVQEGHFSECPLYDLLSCENPKSRHVPWWREHLMKIVVGIAIALAGAIIKLFF